MDNETEELVNRALYKQIKSMNRAEMETFVRNVFAQGYQRACLLYTSPSPRDS